MIYYVEDDLNVRNLAMYALEQAGLEVVGFSSARELYAACETRLPALFLLDIMLPDEDGIQILKTLRRQKATAELPIMMITAKGTEFDVVTGLDGGADDYLPKPVGMLERVSRVNAWLRRRGSETGAGAGACTEAVEIGGIVLSSKRHSVTVEGQPVTLTFKEFELLRFLMENEGIVFSREHLLESIWGWDFEGNTRTIDVHIQTLRQKLGSGASVVETVRGVGYRARKSACEQHTAEGVRGERP